MSHGTDQSNAGSDYQPSTLCEMPVDTGAGLRSFDPFPMPVSAEDASAQLRLARGDNKSNSVLSSLDAGLDTAARLLPNASGARTFHGADSTQPAQERKEPTHLEFTRSGFEALYGAGALLGDRGQNDPVKEKAQRIAEAKIMRNVHIAA